MRSTVIIGCLLTAALISLTGLADTAKSQVILEPDGSSTQDCGTLKVVSMGSRNPGDTLSVVIVARAENAPIEEIEIGELRYPACLTLLEVAFFNEAREADTSGFTYQTSGSISCEDTNLFRMGIQFSVDGNSSKYLRPEVGERTLTQIDFEVRQDASEGVYPLSIPEAEFTVTGVGFCQPPIEVVDSIRVNVQLDDEITTPPEEFSLFQNFPNPFNQDTEIGFALSTSCPVTLEIYTISGQKVTTLVDELRNAGYYSVPWDASPFSSGIYFYRLRVGGFIQTRRMLFLK